MIGGNITATVQKKTTAKNAIGEAVPSWADEITLTGWLDLASGDTRHTNYDAKLQESSHYFLCDYREFEPAAGELNEENARMVIGGKVYEILMVDDPMGMHRHWEFYLKYVGGQGNGNQV